jgi:hypothetical protein
MTFLSEAKADFVYHINDLEDFVTYTFDEHCGSKELGRAYVNSLRKLQLKCDPNDIRTSINQDFNPGPFILIGIPILIDDAQYSLIPALGGWGRSNQTAITGFVSASHSEPEIPDHSWGFRARLEKNPGKLPFELTWEQTQVIGPFIAPVSLKGYAPELTRLILGTYLEFLSHSFGLALLSEGANSLTKELPNVENFVLEMWKMYLDQVDEILVNA